MSYPNYIESLEGAFFPEKSERNLPPSVTFQNDILTFHDNCESRITIVLQNAKPEFSLVLAPEKSVDLHLVLWTERETKTKLSIVLNKGSHLNLLVSLLGKGKLTLDQYVSLGEESTLDNQTGIIRTGNTTYTQKYVLKGTNATLTQNMFAVASGQDKIEIKEDVWHEAVKTVSDLKNNLVASKNGNIFLEVVGRIKKGMKKSECLQSNRGILLHETAAIEVDPQLLIDEFDVNARHGAAIGQINEEELFYLLSRGITDEEAKRLIVSGYVGPYLERLGETSFRNRISNRIDAKIEGVAQK